MKHKRNKNGRFIERSIYQEALEESKKRVDSNPDYYRLRQQITEHQFGTLKRQWGLCADSRWQQDECRKLQTGEFHERYYQKSVLKM